MKSHLNNLEKLESVLHFKTLHHIAEFGNHEECSLE